MSDTPSPSTTPSFADLTAAAFKIGCLGFGGPAGQIALMHRVFVEEKRWISEARYLHALNYCMLLPGPEAQQLATYVGWLLHGVKGGLVAGSLFVLPGALLVFALSWLYAAHAALPLVGALFYGIKAAVLALIVEALVKVGKRALKSRADLILALLACAALYLFGVPFPLVIVAAGVFGFCFSRAAAPSPPTEQEAMTPAVSARRTAAAVLIWSALWLSPLALALALLGPNHVLSAVGLLFSKLAVVTFGGAYAVLAYLQQQAVEVEGWLSAGQMLDGLGLAETTPGPLILVNQFVGFLAGWQAKGGGLGLAAAAAAMASWCTFAPSFLFIFAGAPFAERLRHNARAGRALAAITAAVLGVIANLAVVFGLHILFAREAPLALPWGHSIGWPEALSFDFVAAAIAFAAGFALIRLKLNVILVIGLCALAGLMRALLL